MTRSGSSRRESAVAATLAIAIVILIVTFIVLFIRIDPLLSDFTTSGTITPPAGSPTIVPATPSPTP
jgi:hypothetical protein